MAGNPTRKCMMISFLAPIERVESITTLTKDMTFTMCFVHKISLRRLKLAPVL